MVSWCPFLDIHFVVERSSIFALPLNLGVLSLVIVLSWSLVPFQFCNYLTVEGSQYISSTITCLTKGC